MAGPATRDLAIYRGDDYAHKLTFTDNAEPPVSLNLSDYTFKAQIRDRSENGKVIYATFTIDISQAASGIIVLHLDAASTRIPSGYWDLEATKDSTVQTWLKGAVTMDGDVTQEDTP